MKKAPRLVCITVAVVFAASLFSPAQTPTAYNDVYQVSYFANTVNQFGSDQAIHVLNPGMQGSPLSENGGDVCASLYVYDSSQNLEECCSCPISANGELTFMLRANLLQHPAKGVPAQGVIKLISRRYSSNTGCDPTFGRPVPNLRASMEHLEFIPPLLLPKVLTGTPFLALAPFEDSVLSEVELERLSNACTTIIPANACTCPSGG